MSIQQPELPDQLEQKLVMFCRENRIARELFWAGFGFQVWCQLLTHISRASEATILIVDEPEIYLHPDVQRQLLSILRDISADILCATHSTEIMGEADPSEILLIDKTKKSAKRLKDIEGIQNAMESVGSIQNITLTQLARTRKILFVEGTNDFKIIRRFASKMGFTELASGVFFTALESGGFSSWEKVKSLSWGLDRTVGKKIFIGAIYDRDFWCSEEVDEIKKKLNKNLNFSHIHDQKEIENFLLNIPVLERALEKAIKNKEKRTSSSIETSEDIISVLGRITEESREDLQSQYLAKRSEFLRKRGKDTATINAETLRDFNSKWNNLGTRLSIVSGKDILRKLRTEIENLYGVTLTNIRIIDEFSTIDIPDDLGTLIKNLEKIRLHNA